MQITVAEIKELVQMRDNIRRTVESLEVCWSCQHVSECEPSVVDDGAPVWLCLECAHRAQYRGGTDPGDAFWSALS